MRRQHRKALLRKGPGPRRLASGGPLKPTDFFALHPVFRLDEFAAEHQAAGRSAQTTASVLRYHCRTGRLSRLRRGLYARAFDGVPDPWLVGSKLTADGVIGYQGALSVRGLAGLGHSIGVVSEEKVRPFVFNEVVYTVVAPGPGGFDADELAWQGQRLWVTSLERTFVDLLDRLDLGPEPVELLEIFNAQRSIDLANVVACARAKRNRTCAGRVALFVAHHPGFDRAPPRLGRELERLCPKAPTYFDRPRRSGDERLYGRFNMLVPAALWKALGV